MSNKRGFTLSEVLVVIVLISLIVAIAVPSIISINGRVNKRLFENKKEVILAAAELYGRDNPNLKSEYDITVGKLLEEGYIEKDKDCEESSYGCVINPETKESLNEIPILIRQKNKSIVSIWNKTAGDETTKNLVQIVKKECCPKIITITETSPCYCKNEPDNYLWYSGVMWRVMGVYKIDGVEVVKMISDDNISFEVTSS